jgi:hypothetical protein
MVPTNAEKIPQHAQVLRSDVIIVGGDVTGKFLVPIVESRRRKYTCRFNGLERKVSSGAQLRHLLDMIADSGAYGFVTTPDEYTQYQDDSEAVDQWWSGITPSCRRTRGRR